MTKICREAEASLDYYAMFKNILKQAPLPMSPLESLASSAVRTAHKVRGSTWCDFGQQLGGGRQQWPQM
jgi:pyruvate kinase